MSGRRNWNQLKADTQEWAGAQEMTSSCDCGYTATGTAAETIRQMKEHRNNQHPERTAKPKRKRAA